MKFRTKTSILLRSGSGGDGIISWRREARVRFGGPAGGNGGCGGNIYLSATKDLNSLFHLQCKKHFFAEPGENGMNKSCHGRNGEDLIIKLPCGTNVYDANTNRKITELIQDNQSFLICKGGKGGKGNLAFKCSNKPTPFMCERGDLPEELEIFLELECIADVGFLGFPNAGKSTLLSKISNAKPKIAAFPFTTLIPVLGTVSYKEKKLIFADIPGLIKGASDGLGLGFEFLKHLNRCRILLHIVDGTEEKLIENILAIQNEIEKYSKELALKPRVLIINKIDEIDEKKLSSIKKEIEKKLNSSYICISAKEGINIDTLISQSFELYSSQNIQPPTECDYLEFVDPAHKNEELKITKIDGRWIIESNALKYWTHKIPTTTTDNVDRLKNKITKLEVDKKLLKAGAKTGETVEVYNFVYIL